MDFHKIENVTIDAVKTAHIADKSIQDQYGVKYHQFWVNEEEGTVFCLMEGPDAGTCEKVHQMAHGNIACAMTEVAAGFYEKIMGNHFTINRGHVQKADGTEDLGYRAIMVGAVYGITKAKDTTHLSNFQRPQWARNIIINGIEAYNGRELKWEKDDSLIGAFDDTTQAVKCALEIQQRLIQFEPKQPEVIFKIGISASQPVTAEGDFFNEAIKLAHRLSTTAQNNQALVSSLVKKLCRKDVLPPDGSFIKSLSIKEEEFISNLIHIAEAKLCDEQFDLHQLSNQACISRTQLYRKVKALTGRSPNDFMLDLRMDMALSLLREKNKNITEIAFSTGFNSPSYFTKRFTEKFGINPSFFAKQL